MIAFVNSNTVETYQGRDRWDLNNLDITELIKNVDGISLKIFSRSEKFMTVNNLFRWPQNLIKYKYNTYEYRSAKT